MISNNILENDKIKWYKLRIQNQKVEAVKRFKELNFRTFSSGDSLNDIGMLKEADYGYFYKPADKVKKAFPNIRIVNSYEKLKEMIEKVV